MKNLKTTGQQPTPIQADYYLQGVEDAAKGNVKASRTSLWYQAGVNGTPVWEVLP